MVIKPQYPAVRLNMDMFVGSIQHVPDALYRSVTGQIPLNAKVNVAYDDDTVSSPPAHKDPTLALFEQWAAEDAQMTTEQQTENARIYAEIEQNGIPRVQIQGTNLFGHG